MRKTFERLLLIQEQVGHCMYEPGVWREVMLGGVRLGVQLAGGLSFIRLDKIPKGVSIAGQEKLPED